MAKAINEREIVAAILMEVTENGRYSHIVLREVLTKYQYLREKGKSIYHPRYGRNAGTYDRDRLYSGLFLQSKSKKDEAVNSGNFKKRGLSDKIYG